MTMLPELQFLKRCVHEVGYIFSPSTYQHFTNAEMQQDVKRGCSFHGAGRDPVIQQLEAVQLKWGNKSLLFITSCVFAKEFRQ